MPCNWLRPLSKTGKPTGAPRLYTRQHGAEGKDPQVPGPVPCLPVTHLETQALGMPGWSPASLHAEARRGLPALFSGSSASSQAGQRSAGVRMVFGAYLAGENQAEMNQPFPEAMSAAKTQTQ